MARGDGDGHGLPVVNPNIVAPTDVLETLDFERMAQVVTGVANAAGESLRQRSADLREPSHGRGV